MNITFMNKLFVECSSKKLRCQKFFVNKFRIIQKRTQWFIYSIQFAKSVCWEQNFLIKGHCYQSKTKLARIAWPLLKIVNNYVDYLLVVQIYIHIPLEDLHIYWRKADPSFQLDLVFGYRTLSRVYSICIFPI